MFQGSGELTLVDAADTRALTGAEWPRNRLFELELIGRLGAGNEERARAAHVRRVESLGL